MTDEQLAAFYMVWNMDTEEDRKAWWKDFREVWQETFEDPETRQIAQATADLMRERN